jgi:hypothetical protein
MAGFDSLEGEIAKAVGEAAGGTTQNRSAAESLQLHASPALRAIEKRIEPRSHDLGNADAIVACGIRPKRWRDLIEKRLEQSLEADPVYSESISKLSENEGSVAFAYSIAIARLQKEFLIGAGKAPSCAMLASAPFMVGYDQYADGRADSLPDGVGGVAVRASSRSGAGNSLVTYERMIEPDLRAEALYEANQQCIGLPGYEGRDELENRMRNINARYFPREPSLWIESGEWAQRLLDTERIAEKQRVCVTFDPPFPRSPPTVIYDADHAK